MQKNCFKSYCITVLDKAPCLKENLNNIHMITEQVKTGLAVGMFTLDKIHIPDYILVSGFGYEVVLIN